ncbi:MAG: bifunctional glycosyltransferase family 2/GtrA family protein [Ilumatobacter sp.]|nr:bifunctional glycosyltransferase family 2/GtrA family protein [Ilumatobacter sp.]MCB0985672.1 bifunctional glycosyltransferase family 2/GtrA family protein [Ilumatobacter sp.]
MIILIPAYEPDHRLVDLLAAIRTARPTQRIVVVDDGSGPRYDAVFLRAASLGADVLRHAPNRGKGFALRRGFAHIEATYPGHAVVCADCDGQHTLPDIHRVADALAAHPAAIVLGTRAFAGDVPARSRLGNTVTRILFGAATGTRLQDTQTGLRGYGPALLPWLQTVPGDRFEYELAALLEATRLGITHMEVPIDTVYLEGNRSSHFRPLADSARVYAPLLRFAASSLAAFAIDAAVLFTMAALTHRIVLSVVVARVASATVNFATNRRFVFTSTRGWWASARRYFTLVGVILAANAGLMHLLVTVAGLPILAGKVLTETALFAVSYRAQRRFVFSSRRSAGEISASIATENTGAGRQGDRERTAAAV